MNRVEISYKGVSELYNEEIELTCDKIFDILSIKNWELSLVICDDLFIKELNFQTRGKNEPTDVLSFPQFEEDFYDLPVAEKGGPDLIYVGDIVISIDYLDKNCKEFKIDKNNEFIRLLIHGILHLKGCKHENNNLEEPMIALQEDIIKKLIGVKIF